MIKKRGEKSIYTLLMDILSRFGHEKKQSNNKHGMNSRTFYHDLAFLSARVNGNNQAAYVT